MSRADEPAAPFFHQYPNGSESAYGLTTREHFAAMAMMGFMANKDRPRFFQPKDAAEYCLAIADAFIAALQRPQRGEGE